MKALFLLIPLLMASGCKTQPTEASTTQNTSIGAATNKPSGCPEEGNCTVKIHQQKTLNIQKDDTGAYYPQMVAGETTVVEYTYLKKGPEGTADGDYSETIFFEIPAGNQNLSKTDATLQQVKLLYGKHCFCREAGYYPVTEGTLSVVKNAKELKFNLSFKVKETSQVVTNISEIVKP
jgi:hypothetical protein